MTTFYVHIKLIVTFTHCLQLSSKNTVKQNIFYIPDIYMGEYRRNVKQKDPLLCDFCHDGSKTTSSRGKMIRILLLVTYMGGELTLNDSVIFLLFWPCSFRHALTSPCQMQLLHAFDHKRFYCSLSQLDPINYILN